MNLLDTINDLKLEVLTKNEKEELLEQIRSEIDSIDDSLKRLLEYRASKYELLSFLKKQLGLDNYSPSREKQIIERISSSTKGNLQKKDLQQIFERIVDVSRAIQKRIREKE